MFQDGQIDHLPPAGVGTTAKPGARSPGDVPPTQPGLTSTQYIQPTHREGVCLGAPAAANLFPLNNFKYFLTLFSKFFSSFPRGTCSLSVSRHYLAFDGIYHLLWAAFPNNPTLRKRLVGCGNHPPTGFSPSRTPHSRGLGGRHAQSTLL